MIMSTNKTLLSVASTCVIAALGVVAVGCGGAHLSALREAAEADLQCPKSRVHILNSGKTRDVEACGQRATYHYEDGDWRMIARSGPGAPPPGAAAGQPVMKAAPAVAPAQPAPVMSPTGTPSQPPPSQPPPGGGKSL